MSSADVAVSLATTRIWLVREDSIRPPLALLPPIRCAATFP
jgi:hypothetical protein